MPPDDESTLLDIADAARRIGAVLSGLDQAGFRTDEEAQDAIFYRLVVIGEAVKRLSPSFREDHAEIGWQAIAGLRDILVHAYERVNLGLIWNVAASDVPSLLACIEPLLPAEGQ